MRLISLIDKTGQKSDELLKWHPRLPKADKKAVTDQKLVGFANTERPSSASSGASSAITSKAFFAAAKLYSKLLVFLMKHKHFDVPKAEESELWTWCAEQRKAYQPNNNYLDKKILDRIEKLKC